MRDEIRSFSEKQFLHTESLSVGYESPVVSDIELSLLPGTITVLAGPNGAGKTTLLRTLSRSQKSLSGKIIIDGTDIEKLSGLELSKRLSIMTTERIRPSLMKVREVVSVGRYPYTGSFGVLSDEDNKKVDEAMELTGVIDLSETDFARLSDGQKQRALLSRAICQEPDIIILDEPSSYLDITGKIRIMSVIKSLAKEKNVCVIMSLHELELAAAVADTVISLGEGKILSLGAPEEIFSAEGMEKLYHVTKEEGRLLSKGLMEYAKSLKELIWQSH